MDKKVPQHERVYRSLRTQIMHGKIQAGETLTIRGIAQQFKTSMTPAREAVRRLSAEGAISTSVTGRVSAPVLTTERIEELAALRALIEPEMASRALPRVHMVLVDRLFAINGTISQAVHENNSAAYVRRNLEFHRMLYLRAQAPAMLAMVETIWLQLGPSMSALYAKLQRVEAPENHRKIIAALRAGDEASLRLAIRTDVTQGLRSLID